MDLIAIVGRLARRRYAVTLAAALSAVAGLASGYHISLAPPTLTARAFSYATASNAVVLDGKRTWIRDLSRYLKPVSQRAVTLADLSRSPVLQRRVASRAGISPQRLMMDTDVQFYMPRAMTEAGGDQRATRVIAEDRPYEVVVRHLQNASSLSVYAEAPSGAEAARLVDAAVGALSDYVGTLRVRAGPTGGTSLKVMETGRPVVQEHGSSLGKVLPVAVVLILFPSLCRLVLYVEEVVRRLRRSISARQMSA